MEMDLFIVLVFFLCCLSSRFAADAYDTADPNGNISIKWDFLSIDHGGQYMVMVSIHNCQLFRHVEQPGWRLSWRWAGDEVMWSAVGAEATEQGDCKRVPGGGSRPHCCLKTPVMADLAPGAPYNRQVAGCCRGGVLSSLTQDNTTATAAFQIAVGGFAADDKGDPEMPAFFDLGVPGYSCSNATKVTPTRHKVGDNRYEQALLTWQITCAYSQFLEGDSPSCCVSLSAFYSTTIVDCPSCICGCRESPSSAPQCAATHELPDAGGGDTAAPTVRCSEHMCPIRVHWHVKTSYRSYWRAKVTITNYNLAKNYSDWNLVVQHPNLQSLTQLFSFNYHPLNQYGPINNTGMFWGIKNYNEMLLQGGNVQTEMILRKDDDDFTFAGGWAFPRRLYFDGHQCAMPPPDQYPSLPSAAADSPEQQLLIAGSCLLSLFVFLVV